MHGDKNPIEFGIQCSRTEQTAENNNDTSPIIAPQY